MSRDLHSAILFCAFLSSQARANTQLQTQACSYARPIFSTLFGTNNTRRRERKEHFSKPDKPSKGDKPELRFFDPSFLPKDFRLRHAMRSLKRAANSSLNTPSFLTSRDSRSHRFPSQKHAVRRNMRIEDHLTRALLENRLRKRSMSTAVRGSRPPHLDIPADASQTTEEPVDKESAKVLARRQLNAALGLKLQLYGIRGFTPIHRRHLDALLNYISQTSTVPPCLPLNARLQLCYTLIITAFHQRLLDQFPSPISQLPQHDSSIPLPRSTEWVMAQARALWNSISPLMVQGNGVYEAYYWTAKSQLDAFDGRIADAERVMEKFNDQTANTELSWIVLQAYRMIFLLELHSNGLMVAMQMLMRNWDPLSSCLLGTQGIETFHVTRVYGGLFRNLVFEALDKEDILSLLRAPVDTVLTSSSHRESHIRLILLLLTYTVTRLQDIRSITSITLAQSKLYDTLIQILETAKEDGYSLPEQLLTTCSRELSRGGYEDLANEVLGRASPINHHYSATSSQVVTNSDIPKSEEMHQVSASLMVAARKGDILKVHELFTTLVQSGAVQKRDIRQVLLAYTRAPIYEIESSPLREYDNISHDDNEVESDPIPDRISDAEEIFDRLLAPHRPSVADYSIILYAHARRGNVEKVNAWVERMLEDGILSQDIPWELALRAFAVNGDASAVARVLDHMKQIHNHQHERSGNISSSPNFMTVTIFNILMELMARRRDPWNARRLWKTGVVHGGIKPNFNSVVKLMRAYAEAGDWRGVVQAWDYLQNEATQPWLRANRRGETNNVSIYNVVLRAYVAIGAPFNTVLQLFRKMKTDSVLGAEPDSFTYTMMVISASDGGNMSGALRWFKEMEEMERKRGLPESIQLGEETPDTARQSPRRMTIDYRPIYALTYIMAGFLRQKDWERAKWAYEEIKRRGLIPLPLTYALIIKSYTTAAGKDLEEPGLEVAEHFLQFVTGHGQPLGRSKLKKIPYPRALDTIHAPLLTAYVRKKDRDQVERLFDQISALGGEASIASLTTLMDVYRRLGDVDAVRGTWEKILELAGSVLEDESAMALLADLGEHRDELASIGASRAMLCYPLSIYMDTMSAGGRHAEIAFEWQRLRESGFAFDAHNWNHLVVVLVRAGEVEKAFDVVENVILSYGTATRRLSALQNADPASPMMQGEWEAMIDPPNWGRRRSLMMANSSAEALAEADMLTSRDQSDTSSGSDFVHDLQILHQVRRNWNMWKPHRRVLTVLNRVLLYMESGRLVPPIGVGGSHDRLNPSLSDVSALLSRILNRYPRTARLAYEISHGGPPNV